MLLAAVFQSENFILDKISFLFLSYFILDAIIFFKWKNNDKDFYVDFRVSSDRGFFLLSIFQI